MTYFTYKLNLLYFMLSADLKTSHQQKIERNTLLGKNKQRHNLTALGKN